MIYLNNSTARNIAQAVWGTGRSWLVDAYDNCRDEQGTPWLHKCQNIRECL
jgi:hypothetical protein